MPLRLSERTSNSKALSTIWRFVLSRVSLRALRIKSSSMSMFVLAMNNEHTPFLSKIVYGKEKRNVEEHAARKLRSCRERTSGRIRLLMEIPEQGGSSNSNRAASGMANKSAMLSEHW